MKFTITKTHIIFAAGILFLLAITVNSLQMPFGLWRKQGAEFRSTATAISQATASSIVLPKPSTVQPNDALYAFIWTNDYSSAATTLTPSGWTFLGNITHQSNQYTLNVYRRIADGSEGTNFTFSFSGSTNYSSGVVVAYSIPNTTSPEDVVPVLSAGNVSTGTVTINGVTTTTTAARVIVCLIETSRASTLTAPTGFVEQAYNIDTTNAQSIHVFDKLHVNPQATGTLSTTGWNTSSNRYLGVVLALKQR